MLVLVLMLFKKQGIRVANTATLRDPRQRKALSEAKDKPADNETNFKQAGHDR